MTPLRRDAARNRERILDAARALCADGSTPQLNVVARRAEVGVGTVYRHFPTPEALLEGLTDARFDELTALAEHALGSPDGLQRFLREALRAYAADPVFAEASTNPNPAREETRARRQGLLAVFGGLVREASAQLRPGLDARDLMNLLCGLAYAVRLRPERSDAYLDALLRGLLAAAPAAV